MTAALAELEMIQMHTAMLSKIREELSDLDAIPPCTCDRNPLGPCAQCEVDLTDPDVFNDALAGALAALEESARPATIAEFELALYRAKTERLR